MTSSNRVATRMNEGLRRGIGAANPVSQMVTQGVSLDEAKKRAQAARDDVQEEKEEITGGAKKEEEPEIPSPDKKEPTEAEIKAVAETIKLIQSGPGPNLGTGMNGRMDPPDFFIDPLKEPGLRNQIEKDLPEIDFDFYLWHNYITQTIPLFGKDLILRSLPSVWFQLVDLWLFAGDNVRLSPLMRQRYRQLITVSCMIVAFDNIIPGDADLPDPPKDILGADMKIYGPMFSRRLDWILGMDTAISDILAMNVSWFEQRKRRVVSDKLYGIQRTKKS